MFPSPGPLWYVGAAQRTIHSPTGPPRLGPGVRSFARLLSAVERVTVRWVASAWVTDAPVTSSAADAVVSVPPELKKASPERSITEPTARLPVGTVPTDVKRLEPPF